VNWPDQDRWLALCAAAGLRRTPVDWYARLTAAWSESHRHYHDRRHLAECLAEFDAARPLARKPAAVEFALWFHDAVYDPKAGDNEEKSAALARECLDGAGADPDLAGDVARLVMATKSHQTDGDADAALVVDVDLSILGKDEKRFAGYETQIREEYSWVSQPVFASRRAEILERFLARPQIFVTGRFFELYERQARHNLKSSLAKLRALNRA
jgi:predicted metal-dependent HD superfamily phosphohydrolase